MLLIDILDEFVHLALLSSERLIRKISLQFSGVPFYFPKCEEPSLLCTIKGMAGCGAVRPFVSDSIVFGSIVLNGYNSEAETGKYLIRRQ